MGWGQWGDIIGELRFQNQVIKYLRDNKIFHFRYTASTTFGLPDIICIVDGLFVGLELKNPNGKGRASELQILTAEAIVESGGIAYYNIESLEEVKDIIEEARIKRLSKTDYWWIKIPSLLSIVYGDWNR